MSFKIEEAMCLNCACFYRRGGLSREFGRASAFFESREVLDDMSECQFGTPRVLFIGED